VSSSEAPQNAATEPTAASPIAAGSRGALGVSRRGVLEGQQRQQQRHHGDTGDNPEQRSPGMERRLSAADQRACRDRAENAHVQDRHRPAQLVRWVTQEQRRRRRDQQQAGAQTLQHVPCDEHRRAGRGRREHRASHQHGAVNQQHPPLGQELGELHRQHRPGRIAGIGQARRQVHRLQAHVQLCGDDRRDRRQGRRQGQVRGQEQDDHRRRRRVAAGQRAWLKAHRALAWKQWAGQHRFNCHSRMLAGRWMTRHR